MDDVLKHIGALTMNDMMVWADEEQVELCIEAYDIMGCYVPCYLSQNVDLHALVMVIGILNLLPSHVRRVAYTRWKRKLIHRRQRVPDLNAVLVHMFAEHFSEIKQLSSKPIDLFSI
jgi:hypothetical protein